jgi:hypothetical protein
VFRFRTSGMSGTCHSLSRGHHQPRSTASSDTIICGGLLVIVDFFVIVDGGVSSIIKLAGADERIVGEGGNNFCTSGWLPYVVKEFVDSGSRCHGPIGEMEYYLGWNTGGD